MTIHETTREQLIDEAAQLRELARRSVTDDERAAIYERIADLEHDAWVAHCAAVDASLRAAQ